MSEIFPPTDEPRIVTGDEWLERHKLHVLLGVVIVVLGMSLGSWWWIHQQGRVAEANNLLTSSAGEQDWQKIADDFEGTPAAAMSLLHLGQKAQQSQNFEAALGFYSRFVKEYPKHPFVPAATYAIGLCEEIVGKKEEARATYQSLVSAKPATPFASGASLGLARLLEADGNTTAARQVLTDAISMGDASNPFTAEARGMLQNLPLEASAAPAAAK